MENNINAESLQNNGGRVLDRLDPIWATSRTARQIYALGEVERDISKLLSLAASCISLLTLPQTDSPETVLPQGEERSEQFVLEVGEYFERLDQIQINMRSTLAHIRQARIAPSAINAPPPHFVHPPAGVGTPTHGTGSTAATAGKEASERQLNIGSLQTGGIQEVRMNRDAWRGILDALARLQEAQTKEEWSTA